MKRIYVFLCLILVLFLGSCSDLSVSEEQALKADLPADFRWEDYAEINKDVASSQVVFDVRERNKTFSGTDSAKNAISNCVELLKNEELAEKVYLSYAACPRQGWNRNEKCPGIYANNSNYSKPVLNADNDITGWQCIIGASANSESCWRGGWDALGSNNEDDLMPLKDFLQDSLQKYSASQPTTIGFVPIRTMCMFIPQATDAGEVLDILNNFKLDSVLVIEHYNYMGRYDGRPYKYCKPGVECKEKTQDLADKRGTYYDYGRYTFCLNETEKICVAQ